MTDKIAIELQDFDFGFSLLDADELDVVQQLTTVVNENDTLAQSWMQQAEEWKDKAQKIYAAVQPLLNNLSTQPEKEYIYWPGEDRVSKISAFKLKLMSILED